MKSKRALLGLFVVCQFSIASSRAATYTWDSNNANAPFAFDGASAWTAEKNFYNGTANVSWPTGGTVTDTAVFGNTASAPWGLPGAVTFTTAISAGGITFNPYYGNAAKYNITGGTGGTLTLNGSIAAPPVIATNTTPVRPFSYITAVLAGSFGIDVTSSTGGLFEIGNQSNTFTGTIRLKNGSSLILAADSSLGGAGSGLAFSDASATLITRTTTVVAAGRPISISAGNTARFDSISTINLTLAPTGGITGVGSTLRKEGLGGLILGSANAYTGQTAVRQGTLTLDFVNASAPTSNIVNSSSGLRLYGGTLTVSGKTLVNNTQTFAGMTLDPGASALTASAGASGTTAVTLGAITRNPGSTLDIGTIAAGTGYTTSSLGANGILGGYATVAGTNWASVSGGAVGAYSGYQAGTDATLWGPADNVTLAADPTVPLAASSTVNTLRLTGAANIAIPSAGTFTLAAGGLLTSIAGTGTISGGSIQGSAAGDLVVIQTNTAAPTTISSVIADNGGATALTKSGAGALVLNGANTYSGNTWLNAGSLSADSDAALGSGATVTSRAGTTLTMAGTTAISSAKNFIFDFGSDSYGLTGLGGTATDVGNFNLNVTNPAGLSVSGLFNVTAGTFVKKGAGMLTLTNPGVNQLSRLNGGMGVHVQDGGITFNGGAASEWRAGQAEFVVGTGDNATAGSAKQASVIVQSGLVSVGSWTGIGRGNGTANYQSKIALTGGTFDTGNLSLGYANGVAGYAARPLLDLSGNSSFIARDNVLISESTGADSTINIANTAQFLGRTAIRLATGGGTKATVNMSGTSSLTTSGDLVVAEADSTTGVFNLAGGTVGVGSLEIGKGGNIAGAPAFATSGVINQTGGSLSQTGILTALDWRIGGYNGVNDAEAYGSYNITNDGTLNAGPRNFQVGAYGRGVLDISGTASVTVGAGYPAVARFPGSVGLINLSGGSFNHTATGQFFIVAEEGKGTLNVSGGSLNISTTNAAGMRLGNVATGAGSFNFNGGTLNAFAISRGPGTADIYLNGGLAKATGNNGAYITGLTSGIIGPNGARFDSNGFNVTIGQTLTAASGNGVTGIGAGTPGTAYVGQPIVQITGGGGTGASAIANMSGSPATGFTVTGYTITNPGTGYTTAPTVALVGGGATTVAVPGVAAIGAVAADGGLAKTGAGTLTLAGFNSYNGPTNVTAGTLALGASTAIPSTSALTVTGAELNMGAFSTGVGPVVVNGGNITGTGQLQGASYAISTASGTTTISAQLAGAGANLTKTGAGNLVLTGSNSYSGLTTLSGGVTSLGSTGNLDSSSSLAVNGATLDVRSGTASRVLYLNNLALSGATVILDMTGAGNDSIAASGTASISGTNIIKINGAFSGNRTLISASSPLTGTYTLDTSGMVAGFTTYTGAVNGNNYVVTATGAATPGEPYWKGGVSADWTQAGPSTTSNWTNALGSTNTKQVPGASSNVHFSATSPANTATTLNANLSINSLSFETGSASITSPASTLSILGENGNANGYTLEVRSGATAGMNVNTVYTGTTAVQAGGTLTVSGGTLGNAGEPLLLEGILNVNADVTKGDFSGSGTIDKTLAGTSTFTIGDSNDIIFSGVIKNTTGTLNFAKSGTGKMTLTGTHNTFTGALKIVNGILEIPSLSALQSPSAFIQQPGSTFVNSAGNMTIAYPYSFDLNGGVSAGVTQTAGGGIGNYNIELASGTTTVSGLVSNNGGSLAKRGAGTLVFTNPGANVIANAPTGSVGLAVQQGAVVLDGGASATYAIGAEIAVGDVTANAASLTLNSGTLNVPTYLSASRASGTTGLTSTINLNGGTLNAQYLYSGYWNNLSGYKANSVINLSGAIANLTAVRIAESDGATGTLNLDSGALTATGAFQIGNSGVGIAKVSIPITVGNVQIGSAANGVGAIYNNKVMTVTAGASTTNFAIGNGGNAYGYYLSNPGAALAVQEMGIGGDGGGAATSAGGVLDINAGTVSVGTWITPNRGGAGQTCLLNVSGGSLTTPNIAGQFRVNMDVANQYALINVSGTGSIIGGGANSNINLNNSSQTDINGLLTIGTGGVVQTTGIYASGTAAALAATPTPRIPGNAIVNFDGGTLKAGAAAPALLGAGLTGVFLEAGGAIVDTNTFDAGVTPPLLAPLNAGVTTIALATSGAGYIGRPMVKIVGNGVGATAVANFDPATGVVSGITVTSPGSGYNNAPTVTLIGGGGTTQAVVGTVTMGAVPTTGGLTKNGLGTLTLNGLNTYTGNTVVNAGGLTLADNAQMKFIIGANGVNNSVSGSGTATFNGDFEIDTSGAAIANGNSWTLVNVGTLTETFSATFSVNGFTESGNAWTKTVGSNTWTFSESTGVLSLSVVAAGGYGSWQTTYGLGANSEQGDPDGDGIKNLMEYVLGGIPTGAGAANTSILPTQSLNATNLVLTFRRSDISEADTTVKVQWSSDMVNWTDFATVGATSALPAVQVTEDAPDPTLDTVVVTIPRAGKEANGKLFGRVKAVK